MPRGKTNKEFNIKERVKHATSMSVSLQSNDNDTFPRCVVYALRLIDERRGINQRDGQVYQTLLRSWRKAYSQEIKQRATHLTLTLDIQSPPTESDWQKVGEFLKNEAIRLFIITQRGKLAFDSGFIKDNGEYVALIYNDSQVYYVTKKLQIAKYHKICQQCGAIYSQLHKCPKTCKNCGTIGCITRETSETRCSKCYMLYRNEWCLQHHKCPVRCGICMRVVKGHDHKCEEFTCRTCAKMKCKMDHQCFVRPFNLAKLQKQDAKRRLFVFFDIETALYDDFPLEGEYEQRAVMLCSELACNLCNGGITCKFCRREKQTFVGFDVCVADFANYLFKDINARGVPITVICHYGARFDFHFLVNFLNEEWKIPPKEVLNVGNSLFYIEYDNIKFLDSFKFITNPLRDFPKMWNIPDEVKGYFPHKYTPIDIQYVPTLPTIPDVSFFGIKDRESQDFISWYALQTGEYNLLKQMEMYCKADVSLLLKGIMTFRQMWKDEYGLDPLTRTVTLPAAVMEAFRTNYLKEETIPITPYHGYARNGRTSAEEKAAIEILESKYNVKFNRQVRLGPFIYDGKFRKSGDDRDTIFDYHGCFFHACRKCYPNLQKKEHCFINVDLTRMKDRARKQLAKDAGFHYKALYTHQLHKNYPVDFPLLIDKYLEEDETMPKINHRKTLSGGRTNATRLYYHCEPDEKIEYYDVNGLYPYVLMSKRYPTCHPTYFTPTASDDPVEFFLNGTHEWFGLVQCTILPPRHLSIPVLEFKVGERLTFPLCSTCVHERSNSLCTHSDDERALSGTWTTNAIHYAIQCGYTLMSIKQIEHYESSADGENNPFHAFIKRCMEKKKEAQIQKNSSARSLAKLVANAFWGKLATNADRPRLAFVKTDEELIALASNSSIDIYDTLDLGTLLRVTYRTKDNFIKTPPYTSLISAIFVTDYARLELLRYLHLIHDDDLLYFDTDSVIFKQKRNNQLPFTNIGIECGQMASELEPGEEIDSFGSTGPKSYFYSIRKNAQEPEIKVKIKGLSLTKEILRDCFKTENGMDYLVDFLRKNYTENGEINDPLLVPQSQMRPLNTSQVIVREFGKRFGNEYYKRRIVNDFKTLPWGYCAS